MPAQNRTTLKGYFNTGDRPTEAQFADLIDSALNIIDDKATETQAQDQLIDNKYLTPKSGKKTVEKFAPVKTVNSVIPNATTGNVALVIGSIPSLQASLDAKQATLVSGTNIKSLYGNSLVGGGDLILHQTIKLATDFEVTTVSRGAVPGMNFVAQANKKYMIQLLGEYITDAETTGGSLSVRISAGTASIRGVAEMQGPSGSEKKLINVISTATTAPGSFITSTGIPAPVTAPCYLAATLYFENGATAATFTIRWGSSVGGSGATLLAGTVMIVTPLG